MIGTADDEIGQIADEHQRPSVRHQPEGQGNAALGETHQAGEIRLDAGPVDQRRPDRDNLHAGFPAKRKQRLLGFPFRHPVWIQRCRPVGRLERPPENCRLAIHLDRTHEHQAPDTGRRSLSRQIERCLDIDGTEGGQRIGFSFIHDVNTGGQVHDRIDPGKSGGPVGSGVDRTYRREPLSRQAADGAMSDPARGKIGAQRLPNETRRTRHQDHRAVSKISFDIRSFLFLRFILRSVPRR